MRPVLTEQIGDSRDGFTTHWYCAVPPAGSIFRVLRQEWTSDWQERNIYEIEIVELPSEPTEDVP